MTLAGKNGTLKGDFAFEVYVVFTPSVRHPTTKPGMNLVGELSSKGSSNPLLKPRLGSELTADPQGSTKEWSLDYVIPAS